MKLRWDLFVSPSRDMRKLLDTMGEDEAFVDRLAQKKLRQYQWEVWMRSIIDRLIADKVKFALAVGFGIFIGIALYAGVELFADRWMLVR
jgi:hypothetical protein